MQQTKIKNLKGLTLIELMITICIVAVVMWGVAVLMASDIGHWKTMYDRLNSNAANNSYEIRRLFDRVVRQAPSTSSLAASDTSLDIDYYDYVWDSSDIIPSAVIKAHASFNYSNNTLTVVCTNRSTGVELERLIISNVANKPPFFKLTGRAAQMMLTINNSSTNPTEPFSEQIYVCSTAYFNAY